MSWLVKTFTSHSGRKLLAALTGLGVVLFLILHLIGNTQIFSRSSAFNDYAHSIHSGLLIVLADVGLLVAFPLHIAMVLWLAIDNKKARGAEDYKVVATKQKRGFAAVLASRTTLYSGLVLLFFIAIHVWQFRLHHDSIAHGTFGSGVAPGDLRQAVIVTLKQPHWGLLYLIGSLATGWHLFHGIQAGFRSLGAYHPRYTPLIVKAGAGLAFVLAVGFASMPAWILLS